MVSLIPNEERAHFKVYLRQTFVLSLSSFSRLYPGSPMYDDDTLTGLDKAGRARQHRGGRPVFSGRGAIYHLNVRTGSRSKGQSARAAAAYIQREAEYSRDRETADELVYAASGHMPAWAEADPTSYWDAADLHERANGRLFQRVEVALPTALSAEEQRELAVGFARHLTDGEQLPYTLAIHAGEGTNPHCHLLISERTNDGLERSPEQWFRRYNAAEPEQGGARKTTAMHSRTWLLETRAAWAEQTNQALAEAGYELRIDHRSYAEQGIERLPGLHLGPTVREMEARGIETERGAEVRRRERVNEQLLELTAQREELAYERPANAELERRDSHLARGRDGPAQGDRGPRPPSLERGPTAGRGAEAERDNAGPEYPGPVLAVGGAGSRGAQADVASDEADRADVPGVGPGGMGVAGSDLADGRGDDGRRGQSADRVADVAEQDAVARWDELLTDAAAEARERKAQAQAEARREREQERQRERERDEDLEWER